MLILLFVATMPELSYVFRFILCMQSVYEYVEFHWYCFKIFYWYENCLLLFCICASKFHHSDLFLLLCFAIASMLESKLLSVVAGALLLHVAVF